MIKKFLFLQLTCVLLFCTNALDGFDLKFNKFINFYFIDQSLDWGNLYLEGRDVDFKAAVLAQQKLNGGHFDEKIHSVVPNNFFQTEKEWKEAKECIASLIGPISNPLQQESAHWKNSAHTVDQLLQDAQQVSQTFMLDFQNIALRTNGVANFGPSNQFVVKTRKSLEAKVNRDARDVGMSIGKTVTKIGDALRGTLIVNDLNQVPQVVTEIVNYADNIGAKVAFKNLWTEERASGYVGIHAKILYPLPNQERYILTEMQIHLASMVDGSEASAKERAHLIYESVRDEKLASAELSAASKLLFLTAMEETMTQLKKEES